VTGDGCSSIVALSPPSKHLDLLFSRAERHDQASVR
jgi:hypothetical protein